MNPRGLLESYKAELDASRLLVGPCSPLTLRRQLLHSSGPLLTLF